jgi:hypothetical protein
MTAPDPGAERSAGTDSTAGGSRSGFGGDSSDAKPKRRWWRRGLRG